MNYDKYIELIGQEKYLEATQYKSSQIPSVLYKYYWLDEKNEEKNNQRLETLSRGEVFLASIDTFNDPFEGKAFEFDINKLSAKGWERRVIDDFIKRLNESARICCFSDVEEKQNNMPMWAYYANNHHGFCVEYEISNKQKKYIYPVSYEECRAEGNSLLTNLLNGLAEMVKRGETMDDMSGEMSALNHLAYLSLTAKHISWKHEREFRALVPIERGIIFPAIPHKIYIGMECEEKYQKRLIEIANSFQGYCEIYKMKCDGNNRGYYLVQEKI